MVSKAISLALRLTVMAKDEMLLFYISTWQFSARHRESSSTSRKVPDLLASTMHALVRGRKG